MAVPEYPLSGGHMTSVVRVGDTVRRSTGPWSPAVHSLLRYLASVGFAEAPRFLGIDAAGREILTYVAGEAGFFSRDRVVPPGLWSDQVLTDAAKLLRRFHDATVPLLRAADCPWPPMTRDASSCDVICHNDFAPWNCVFRDGSLVAAIDFDSAAPGSRVWDLAYAAYTFVPLYDDDRCRTVGLAAPPDRARRLRLICDAYGLAARRGFVAVVEQRIRAIIDVIQANAAAGETRFQWKVAEGHLEAYITNLAYVRRNRNALQAALEGR